MEPDRKTPEARQIESARLRQCGCVLCACRVWGRRLAGSSRKPRRQRLPDPGIGQGTAAWNYDVVPQWGKLPPGKRFGGTHGAISSDKAGNVYVSTQSETGVLVYEPGGRLLKAIATQYPEVHSLHWSTEGGEEFFYATCRKGTPAENWLVLKMKTDGTVSAENHRARRSGIQTAK